MTLALYLNDLKKTYTNLLKGINESNPLSFWAGFALFPIDKIIADTAKKIFQLPPIHPMPFEIYGKNQFYFVIKSPFVIMQELDIVKPIIFSELFQNYLLNQKCSDLLNRIAPHYSHLPKTTIGKMTRVILTALLDASIVYWLKRDRFESIVGTCSIYSNESTWNNFNFCIDDSSTHAVNAFIATCLAGAIRELTGNCFYGVGFYFSKFRVKG